MSTLQDYETKLQLLLEEAVRTRELYTEARQMLSDLLEGKQVDLSQITMNLDLGKGVSVPVPFSGETDTVAYYLAQAAQSLGQENVRLWREVHAVAETAKRYCDAAEERLRQQQQEQDDNATGATAARHANQQAGQYPAQPQPGARQQTAQQPSREQSPREQSPREQPPREQGPANTVPRLNPVSTVDVSAR